MYKQNLGWKRVHMTFKDDDTSYFVWKNEHNTVSPTPNPNNTYHIREYQIADAPCFECHMFKRPEYVAEVLFNGQRFPTIEAAVVALKVSGHI